MINGAPNFVHQNTFNAIAQDDAELDVEATTCAHEDPKLSEVVNTAPKTRMPRFRTPKVTQNTRVLTDKMNKTQATEKVTVSRCPISMITEKGKTRTVRDTE